MAVAGCLIQRDIQMFFSIPAFVVCVGGMISLSMADYGVERQSRVLVLMCRAFLHGHGFEDTYDARDVRVAHGMIASAYLAGATGLVIGLIQVFTHLNDAASIRCGLAIAIYCPLYAIILAAGLLHPSARRLEEKLNS